MPYIPAFLRHASDARVKSLATCITSPGQLNYCITTLLLAYLGPEANYAKYNEVIGVLECAKLELYRRAVAKYEDGKCEANGDVFEEVEP